LIILNDNIILLFKIIFGKNTLFLFLWYYFRDINKIIVGGNKNDKRKRNDSTGNIRAS
jgi:hypothetical protein